MKTRGQCYYFCYDTHSFNNPSVHILTAGIRVLAFQGSICPLIKADIILLSLVSNSAHSRCGSSLQSHLRDSQHGCVVKDCWRRTKDTKETLSAWPRGTSSRLGNSSQVFCFTMSFPLRGCSFFSAASSPPPKVSTLYDSSHSQLEKYSQYVLVHQ